MATLVLAAAGTALGGAMGGSVLGLSTAVIGRAVGAAIGQRIDQRLLGAGSDAVETGQVDRFRLTGASEGAAIPQVFGQYRVGGQVIWASEFLEDSSTTGGGKWSSQPSVTTFDYSVSMAVAVCEGPIAGIGRVWADGNEVARSALNMRVYLGGNDQLPDPKMEAVEGVGNVPAYRGVAYVVFEDLPLSQFGNRVPQFSFEVFRPSQTAKAGPKGVAIIPGTGEYALATTSQTVEAELGQFRALNTHAASGDPDFVTSLNELENEVPEVEAASLVVSWFGDDLRAGHCSIRPMVEPDGVDPTSMPWTVGGVQRDGADTVPVDDNGRSVYGGTPCDQSVVDAIQEMKARGIAPTFYPFILMTQLPGNGLPDPLGGTEQAKLPWRGRITTSIAPERDGTPDQTSAADAEVAAFFGTAQVTDFSVVDGAIQYLGPDQWGYRRFILHYAHLCALAGGVDAFCIGSEMRGLTQIRGANGFPAVEALRALAADVRLVLGPEVKISYAADWSEYHGYQPVGTSDKLFHLDPLWADENIDFIGVDNYLPLSDWRDEDGHADESWASIYNLEYLKANVAGGEMFDWYYHSGEARDAQIRTPIEDALGKPWMWRAKDFVGWWSNYHYDRVDGQQALEPSAWIPGSKPIWFTEFGCAAIDKGTNQPNKFLDAKSSESALPYYSNAQRDDLLQARYVEAVLSHFEASDNNPISDVYAGRMLDTSRCFVWCWDARPFPQFPGLGDLWSDGENYQRGHWLNGRGGAVLLSDLVSELCVNAGVSAVDTTHLYGLVRGYRFGSVTSPRAALQDLSIAYGFDACERNGVLTFISRSVEQKIPLDPENFAVWGEGNGIERMYSAPVETPSKVRLNFAQHGGDYDTSGVEAQGDSDSSPAVSQTQMDLLMTTGEAQQIADRWVHEISVGTQTATFALPPSQEVKPGSVVEIDGDTYRVDQISWDRGQQVEATRVSLNNRKASNPADEDIRLRSVRPNVPITGLVLDLPKVDGDADVPNIRFAATGVPWPGEVAVYRSMSNTGFSLDQTVHTREVVGELLEPLAPAQSGRWQRGDGVEVKLVHGQLSSVELADILAGANTLAIGDSGSQDWELVQFKNADLVAANTYRLSGLLREQGGDSPSLGWPVRSKIVLLTQNTPKLSVSSDQLGLEQFMRFGPVGRPMTDSTFRTEQMVINGHYRKPLSVCHLSARHNAEGTSFTWVRRGRIDADRWTGIDIPLGEEIEQYLVRIWVGGEVAREVTVSDRQFDYSSTQISADGAGIGYDIEVCQMSQSYGPGAPAIISVGAS